MPAMLGKIAGAITVEYVQSVILMKIVEVYAETPNPAFETTSKLKSNSISLIVGIAIVRVVLSVKPVLMLTDLRLSEVVKLVPVKV